MKTLPMKAGTGWRAAADAALVMAIGMGFGRFAFTAIYPHMIDEGILNLYGGSLAASANYAGYLLGALLAVHAKAHSAHRLCLWAMAGTAICLIVLYEFEQMWMIVTVRGLAGIFSALSMVAASLWLLEQRKFQAGAPLLYAAVGVGIALSAELLVLGTHFGLRSAELWLLLGVVSLIIGILAVPGLMASGSETPAVPTAIAEPGTATVRPFPLVSIYGLAGFGYIITATYLPLLVKTALPNVDAAHVWAVFGLGAAPSCFLWHVLNKRLGTKISLVTNLIVQAIGVGVPVLIPSAIGYLLSALLVGGSFMGTVTIAMPAAQGAAKQVPGNLMAIMTFVYGLGQISGPLVANIFYERFQSLSGSLIAAAVALLAASLIATHFLIEKD
jgi:MFS family permease